VSTLGFALLVIAAALTVAEAHIVSFGVLGTLAVAAFAAGLGLLVNDAGAALGVAVGVGVGVAIVGAAFGGTVFRRLVASQRSPVAGGSAGLIGRRGEVRTAPEPVGCVLMDGALWRARTWECEEDALRPGDPIVVEGVDGLTLTVRRAEDWEVAR
jgi:membrane-bound ClpP family serine protease